MVLPSQGPTFLVICCLFLPYFFELPSSYSMRGNQNADPSPRHCLEEIGLYCLQCAFNTFTLEKLNFQARNYSFGHLIYSPFPWRAMRGFSCPGCYGKKVKKVNRVYTCIILSFYQIWTTCTFHNLRINLSRRKYFYIIL